MSEGAARSPEPSQVVSDLGQLIAFSDPMKMRILRILQHQEATTAQLVEQTSEKRMTVTAHVRGLRDLKLINVIGKRGQENIYRATARVYNLRPEPQKDGTVTMAVATATLDSVSDELVASLTQWPNQKMNYEGRRARMSYERAGEFNEKLDALITEYWGDPNNPVKEDPGDPLLALIAAWYRFPEEQ